MVLHINILCMLMVLLVHCVCYWPHVCHELPWTGLLASGDDSCHWWMAVGVRSGVSGKTQSLIGWHNMGIGCTWTYDRLFTLTHVTRQTWEIRTINRVPSCMWYLVDLLYKQIENTRRILAEFSLIILIYEWCSLPSFIWLSPFFCTTVAHGWC